jgi:hypothetical protein
LPRRRIRCGDDCGSGEAEGAGEVVKRSSLRVVTFSRQVVPPFPVAENRFQTFFLRQNRFVRFYLCAPRLN